MSGHIPNLNQVFREGGKARAENASAWPEKEFRAYASRMEERGYGFVNSSKCIHKPCS